MRKFTLTYIITLCSMFAFGQDNNFKINLLPTAWGEIRLGYERTVGSSQSFQVNYGIMTSRELPNFIYNEADVENYGGTANLQNEMSGFSISAEFRFYTSTTKYSPRGFYIGFYGKYNKYDIKASTSFNYKATFDEYLALTPEQQEVAEYYSKRYHLDVTGNFNGHLRQAGGGIMFGYQWFIADVVSIDWTFLGFGFDSYVFQGDLATEEMEIDYQRWGNEIKKEITDMPFIGDNIEVTVEQDKVSGRAPFMMPNVKFTLSLGFAF